MKSLEFQKCDVNEKKKEKKEKKYSSTHQNTDTSFPKQETLTNHL